MTNEMWAMIIGGTIGIAIGVIGIVLITYIELWIWEWKQRH
jgi:hypothetical protein